MLNAMILMVGLAAGILHVIAKRRSLNKVKGLEIILLYSIVFGIGIVSIAALAGQFIAPDKVAPAIGWALSPLQKDVGIYAAAWGLLGLLAIWLRGNFWHAVVMGWSVFMVGAFIGHVKEAIVPTGLAPYNYGAIFYDIGATILIVAIWVAWIGLNKYKRHTI